MFNIKLVRVSVSSVDRYIYDFDIGVSDRCEK